MKIFYPVLKMLAIFVAIASVILIIEKTTKRKEDKIKRFALVQYNDSPLSELSMQGVIDELTACGYVRGKNYEMSISNAQGDMGVLNLMVDAAANEKPDLLFITSTPTLQAVIKKIKTIPVVFTVVADPVLAGAGRSFEDHIANITGISTLGDYEGMVKWIKKILPSARTIGTLFSPGESNSVKNMQELQKCAADVGLTLITVPVNSSQEVSDACLSLTSHQPDVICQIVDNLTSTSASTIMKIAKKNKIPVFGFVSDQSEKGAVLVVSRDYNQAGRDAVRLAKRILDGESPASIPFEYVSKTNILINRTAAADHGITIPKELILNKDVIITK